MEISLALDEMTFSSVQYAAKVGQVGINQTALVVFHVKGKLRNTLTSQHNCYQK